MKTTVACAVASALLIATASIHAQRDKSSHPDLQGTWIGSTLTPLQRPPEFKDKAALTPEEAAEYVRTAADRIRARLPTELDRLTQADIDDMYVETEVIKLDGLRTSLIVDPPNGMLPPLLPAAQARIAARPKRTYEDPETFNLAERCLLGNFGLGGSAASPPMLPSVVAAYYYQIVQTDDVRDDFRRVGARCSHHSDEQHASRAINQEVARRFDRPLGGIHARGRYHELPARDPQRGFRRTDACRRTIHENRRQQTHIPRDR